MSVETPFVVSLSWYNGLGYVPGPTRVTMNLYQGALACEPTREAARRGEFALVVNCAGDVETPSLPAGVETIHIRLRDNKDPMPLQQRLQLQVVIRHIQAVLARGQKVLVACAMGLNRSSLVVGATLRTLGASGDQAVALIRKARGPFALKVGGGPYFETLIRRGLV